MLVVNICDRCKQEVRYGSRDGVTGWLHREPVDHQPRFGPPGPTPAEAEAVRQAWLAEHTDDPTTAPEEQLATEPEVRAIPMPLDRPRTFVSCPDGSVAVAGVPGGTRTVLNAARKAGWTVVRSTYARGPWMHATYWRPTAIVDTLLVVLRRGEQQVAAEWRDGSFEWGYTWASPRAASERVNSKDLKDFIKADSNTLESETGGTA